MIDKAAAQRFRAFPGFLATEVLDFDKLFVPNIEPSSVFKSFSVSGIKSDISRHIEAKSYDIYCVSFIDLIRPASFHLGHHQ